jgi:hypothetical protein
MSKNIVDENTPVNVSILNYWACYPVGGSGLSISLQMNLRSMSREILTARGLPIPDALEELNVSSANKI